jgi:hypothetical protein
MDLCKRITRCLPRTFIWAARVCIELDNELDSLGGAGHANQRDDSLPSWVPDWLQTHTHKRLGPFRQTSEQSKMTCDAKRSRQTGLESRLERRGVGLGRLEFDEVLRSGMPDLHEAFSIAAFPICAFEPPKANTSSMTKLSKSKLLEFCKSVAKHDPGQCECIHFSYRTKHCPTRCQGVLSEGAQNGDWLCTLEGSKDRLPLRPVPSPGEAQFLLVGRIPDHLLESVRGHISTKFVLI